MPNCLACNKAKKITDFNYAEFDIKREGHHAFPERIDNIILPGDKDKGEFLCASCASKVEVKCKVHGAITDDCFSYGKPPRCKKCDDQLESIKKAILPEGFLWLVPLTMIHSKLENIRNRGFLAASDDGELHVISKDILYSGRNETFLPQVTEKKGILIFIANTSAAGDVSSCEIDLKDPSILSTASGPWFQLWAQVIANTFHIRMKIDHLCLVSIKVLTMTNNHLSPNTEQYPVAILLFHNKKLVTFPKIDFPPFTKIKCWRTVSDNKSTGIELVFTVKGIPQSISLYQLYSSEGPDQIEKLEASLPISGKNDNPNDYCFSHAGLFEGKIYPSRTNHKILLQVIGNKVFATLLPKRQTISFSKGFSYGDTYLFLSDDSKMLAIKLNEKDTNLISNAIFTPEHMFEEDDFKWGFFFDKDDPSLVHKLEIFLNSFRIDGSDFISSDNIDEISIKRIDYELSEIMLTWKENGHLATLTLISPEFLTYETSAKLERSRANACTNYRSIPDLYKKYNSVKKSNLLVRLFVDIILLKRELDEDVTMRDLSTKIGKLDVTSFYQERAVKELAIQKILLLSLFIPKIKQNFEYLSAFYPYYHLTNEAHFLASAFGNDVARTIIPNERKKIVSVSRRNVRSVQSNIQKAIGEIDRAIRPVEDVFASKEIEKTMSSKIVRNTPLVGQILLVSGMLGIGVGTGVGILAGMLGIRTLGELLNRFQKSHKDAATIKRAMETVFAWWQVLLDTLPVTIFEAGELIDEENIRCMKRDKEIFDSLPLPKKSKEETLNHALKRSIEEGIRNINSFIESEQGFGISMKTIHADIDSAISKTMPKMLDNYSKSLPLVPANN